MTAFWRSPVSIALLVAGAVTCPAGAQFCPDPILPPCCPSPCPVFDASRVPKLLGDVETLGKAIGVDTQIIQSASQIEQSIGGAAAAASAVAKQVSGFAGTLSSEVTAVQAGLSVQPVDALVGIKQTLFEPANMAASSATQGSSRRSARNAAAQGEQVAALAVSLMRIQALPGISPQQSQLAAATSGSQQLQGDLAANSTSRLAVYQDVGALHQLVAAWVAQRSMQSANVHPVSSGSTSVSPASASNASPSSNPTPSQNIADTLDQLVALHDARVAAQVTLSTYPALQQTIAAANLAGQFASNAEAGLRQGLSDIGVSNSASLLAIETALRTADTTDWLDGTKTLAAQQAVAKVTDALMQSGQLPASRTASLDNVQTAMIGWLDADKQSRYWTGQASQAQQSLAALDANLGALSDRAGVDVTGTSGSSRESALIATLSHNPTATQWRPLLVAAAKDASARSVLGYSVVP